LEECKGVTLRRGWWLVVLALVVAVALGLAQSRAAQAPPAPLTILVSFDGWRWDYDSKAPAPALRALMARGVRAEGLVPAFPTKTLPNHYTMATGLYPGHHGMIANVIRDPETGRMFRRTDRVEVKNPMWWGGEPIWNTAQRQGLIAATMFWPGSEAPVGGMQPRYWREFDATVPPAARVDQVLAWLDTPAAERPSLVTLYFDEVDVMGHWYGPDSSQVKDAIVHTDAQLGRLVQGLATRRLLDRANLVVVSDHGMAPTTQRQTIFVDNYVSLDDIEIADINPTLGVIPKPAREEAVYRALANAHPRLSMFRSADTPESWHLRGQPRVPPITGVADEGWVVLRRADFAEYWKHSPAGGQHGYDPEIRTMRGIFVAAGPAFKAGATVPAMENVNVYRAVALALGVEPRETDADPAVVAALLR
jgi:predicted AlkP superfamily pyrophosphatase or phosphodiesterase